MGSSMDEGAVGDDPVHEAGDDSPFRELRDDGLDVGERGLAGHAAPGPHHVPMVRGPRVHRRTRKRPKEPSITRCSQPM